jgi:hypothetical protein
MLTKKLVSVKDFNTLVDAIIWFAVLVVPTVLFILHVKRREGVTSSWLIFADYLFLFFVTAYSLSMTVEKPIPLDLWGMKTSLVSVSITYMLSYPPAVQVLSLMGMPGLGWQRIRRVPYEFIVKPHDEHEMATIDNLLLPLGLLAFFWGYLALSMAIIGFTYAIATLSEPRLAFWIPRSTKRNVFAYIWSIAIAVTLAAVTRWNPPYGILALAYFVVFIEIASYVRKRFRKSE